MRRLAVGGAALVAAAILATQTVTVTATSTADSTKSASAKVTLNPSLPVFTSDAVVNAASLKPGDWISLKSVPQLGELRIQVRAHQK